MLRRIVLHGALQEKFGGPFQLDVVGCLLLGGRTDSKRT